MYFLLKLIVLAVAKLYPHCLVSYVLPTNHTLSVYLNIGVIYTQILDITKLSHHKSYKKKCDFSLMFHHCLEVTSIIMLMIVRAVKVHRF